MTPDPEPDLPRSPGPVCSACGPTGLIDPIGSSPSARGPRPPVPAPQPTPVTSRMSVGGKIQEAKLINRVAPPYPPLCKQMRLEGEIVLHAIIANDGTIKELSYVKGHPCFLQHTMNAVAQWRYQPTLLNGVPVEVETNIIVIYKINH